LNRFAAAHVILPDPLIRQETDGGRDPATFIETQAPSAVAVAAAYQITAPRAKVYYSAPDEGRWASWVFALPVEAAAVTPIDESLFTDTTFMGLFRMRGVLDVGLDTSQTGNTLGELDAKISKSIKSVIDKELAKDVRSTLFQVMSEKVDKPKDVCRVSIFRHLFAKPGGESSSNIQSHKVVVELAIPRVKNDPLLRSFRASFLDPDGDVQNSKDKLLLADLFRGYQQWLEANPEQGGTNITRQHAGRKSWAWKLHQRREFLADLFHQFYTELATGVKKADKTRVTQVGQYFCNSWQDSVVEVEENTGESTWWQYAVNSQPISNQFYVVTEDMGSLLCFENKSAIARDDHLPCVWAGDVGALQQEMAVREFKPVNEVTLVFSRVIADKAGE
jgi:hypothetical protein